MIVLCVTLYFFAQICTINLYIFYYYLFFAYENVLAYKTTLESSVWRSKKVLVSEKKIGKKILGTNKRLENGEKNFWSGDENSGKNLVTPSKIWSIYPDSFP